VRTIMSVARHHRKYGRSIPSISYLGKWHLLHINVVFCMNIDSTTAFSSVVPTVAQRTHAIETCIHCTCIHGVHINIIGALQTVDGRNIRGAQAIPEVEEEQYAGVGDGNFVWPR
jgi:hypothetical protein